jgi:glycosyltransferase involved in cell wall biosynthesis
MRTTQNQLMVDLSVVVAAQEAGSYLPKCLAGLQAQLFACSGEVVVVDGSGRGAALRLAGEFPSFRFFELPQRTEVPKLWKAGIEASHGRIVALTIEHCVPGPGWIQAVLRAHAVGPSAIGGAMEIDPGAGLVDRAIYFCRYSGYIPPFPPRWVDDLAGDNCSYKRAALDELRAEMAEGFWETFTHQAMRRRGERLLCDPSILMYYAGPLAGLSFLRTRLAHGRYFAARRARALSRLERFLRAAAFPIVPFLMLGRVGARVWRARRHRALFLLCAPLLMIFLAAWSAGEFLGYLLGPPKEQIRGKEETAVVREAG